MGVNVSNKVANGGIIAAAMVVGIHVCDPQEIGSALWWWDAMLRRGLFQVAVPFFFVCSGYFLCRHYECARVDGGDLWAGWRGEMRKRVKSLLLPYVIWSVIGVCVLKSLPLVLAANVVHGRSLLANMPGGWRFWLHAFGGCPFCWPFNIPLWYVRALLMYAVVSPVPYFLMRRFGGWKVCLSLYFLVVAFSAGVFGGARVYMFFRYCFSLSGFFFFAVGCWLSLRDNGLARFANALKHVPMLAVGFALTGMALIVWRNLLWCRFGEDIQLFKCLTAPILLVAFWFAIPSGQWPKWLVSSSFPVYLIHALLWPLIGRACCLAGWPSPFWMRVDTIAEWLLKWVIGFGGSLAISVLLRRLWPGLARVLFGGR